MFLKDKPDFFSVRVNSHWWTKVWARSPSPPDFSKYLSYFHQIQRGSVQFLFYIRVLHSRIYADATPPPPKKNSSLNFFEHYRVLRFEFQVSSKSSEKCQKNNTDKYVCKFIFLKNVLRKTIYWNLFINVLFQSFPFFKKNFFEGTIAGRLSCAGFMNSQTCLKMYS